MLLDDKIYEQPLIHAHEEMIVDNVGFGVESVIYSFIFYPSMRKVLQTMQVVAYRGLYKVFYVLPTHEKSIADNLDLGAERVIYGVILDPIVVENVGCGVD